jgi:hypothetical protein
MIRLNRHHLKSLAWTSILICFPALAAPPSTAPSSDDATVDWLMGKATTQPAAPAAASTQPAALFKNQDNDGSRPGVIELSNGQKLHGKIATTAEKPVRVWVESEKDYEDIPFSLIQSVQSKVLWERDEAEWHFKASGSDIKEYSGKTYPARETQYTLTLVNGQKVEGDVVAPLYFTADDGKTKTYVLHKRDKGEVGQTLDDLVYVKRVSLEKS